MKRAILAAAAALLIPWTAYAVQGYLVRSEVTTSVTGRLVYVCYYDVMGTTQQVVLTHICPPTMDFD